MSGIFQSRIVRGLAQPLLSVGGTATAVCLYEQALQDGYLPAYFPSLVLPTLPFDITSFALSLLLVFRCGGGADTNLLVSVCMCVRTVCVVADKLAGQPS